MGSWCTVRLVVSAVRPDVSTMGHWSISWAGTFIVVVGNRSLTSLCTRWWTGTLFCCVIIVLYRTVRVVSLRKVVIQCETLQILTMEVQIGGLFFTSNFDSGNLSKVEKVVREHTNDTPVGSNIPPIKNTDFQPDYEFNVWTKPDCANTIYENGNRSWFHFGIRGASAGKLIKINIVNMNRQGRLYSQGYCPLVRTLPGKPKWERIRDKPSYETIDGQFILTFIHRFTELKGSTTYFAFAYPHSYLECQNQVSEIEKKFEYCKNFSSASNYPNDTVYFYRELLCHSLENLRIDLITISSFHGITDQEEPRFDAKLFPEKEVPRCREFKNKRVFVLTSRVHPGETPASFVFSGFLNFILRNEDPRAIQLRKHHASRKGCFIYGNFLEDDELQIQNMLYPKLVSLNTAHFEFSACNFSQRNMYLRDKRDGLSKEGSGRVAVYKSTGIIHSYTLECNYNTGKVMNPVAPAYGDNGRASPPTVVGIPPKYTPSIFEDVGRAVAIAALDMNDTNPWSRVTLSEYKHLLGAKEWLKKYCLVPKGFTRPKNAKPPLRTLSFSHFSSNVPSRFIRASESFSSPGSGPASMSVSAHLSSQMGPKKELRPVREASRRFSSCPRKLNLLVSDKGSISHSATKPPHSSYSALSGNTSQPFPSTRCKSLPVSKLSVQTTSSLSPCKLAQSSLSHSPSFDSYIPKTGKIGQLKSAPTIVRSKTNNSSSSVHKKPSGRSNLIRSMSGASDSHCVTVRYHSRSVDSPKLIATASSSHGRSHSFKQRYLHSTSDHAVATSKKKLSTDLNKRDGTSATPSSSEFNKKLTAESTTSEIPRNIPPKKKRRFSLLKKKQAAVNFLKGNIAPLQVADSGSGLKLKEEGYTQSHSAKISSKHTKQVGQSMGVQGSVTNLSNKRNKKSKEQIWSTNQVYNESNLLPVQTSGH
ncbi:AGBL5 [Acanthosepion pharaonis]|uniref:tubulin-glutamate carboxypeptidase n=1 Tax=Acanthosepion pharaonis TaxID=158019 RepID=A0A812BM27_ACAPH|nr:AGBL5 [Sepia pharaonis]